MYCTVIQLFSQIYILQCPEKATNEKKLAHEK